MLSTVFVLNVNKVSSLVNKEINNNINISFDYYMDKNKNHILSPIHELSNEISETIISSINIIIQNEMNQIFDDTNIFFIDKIQRKSEMLIQQKLLESGVVINSEIYSSITKTLEKFPYDYYINIYKKENKTKKLFNEKMVTNIKLFNLLLIIFLIFFIFISLNTKSIILNDVYEIFILFIVVFIFVGVFQMIFIKTIVSKYVPVTSSSLYILFFTSLKNNLKEIII